jgi:hypothetical protein
LIVRTGVTRTVLLVGRYAVKVPTLRGVHPGGFRGRLAGVARGLLANLSEHTWSRYGPWAGKVAPVLWSGLGGFVQVYPRCEPLAGGDRGPLPQLDPCPGDVKPDNFGWLGRRVVRLDYTMD